MVDDERIKSIDDILAELRSWPNGHPFRRLADEIAKARERDYKFHEDMVREECERKYKTEGWIRVDNNQEAKKLRDLILRLKPFAEIGIRFALREMAVIEGLSGLAGIKAKPSVWLEKLAELEVLLREIYEVTGEDVGDNGDSGAASATGDGGAASAMNPTAIAVAWGPETKARGVKGAHIVVSEWRNDEYQWTFLGAKLVHIDGKKYKAETWYTLKDGKVVEVEE